MKHVARLTPRAGEAGNKIKCMYKGCNLENYSIKIKICSDCSRLNGMLSKDSIYDMYIAWLD